MRGARWRHSISNAAAKPTPLLVFGAMLSASLAMRCASKSDSGDGNDSGGSSTQSGGTASGGTSTGGVIATGGVTSTGGVISTGGTQSGSCTAATVMTDCPLPPSVCQDGLHLTYYTTPECVSGQCRYTEQTYPCPGFCASGACGASTTTTMIQPPLPDPRCLGGAAGSAGSAETPGGAGGAMGARIIIGGGGFGPGGSPAMSGSGGAGGVSGEGGMSGAGAMGSTSCELPASVCADAQTLVYYTNPYCDFQYQCRYTSNTLDCMGPCTNGACQGGFTAPAPP